MTPDPRIRAIIIRPESPSTQITKINPDVTLYQQIVGTEFVDALYARTTSGEPITFYIGDTSAVDDCSENVVATRLWHSLNPEASAQTLYGTCIVVGADGTEDADVPASVVRRFRRIEREVEGEGLVEGIREQDK
jgi:hypothetical protein